MFLSDGFHATTMDAIAAAIPVPKTTLYKRFPDKFAVLDAVLRARISAWSLSTTKQSSHLGNDLRERLIHHTTTLLVWTTKPEVRAVRLLALSAARRGIAPQVFAYLDMANYIRDEIATFGPGSNIQPKDPERIAQTIMSMISGWLSIEGIDTPLSVKDARAQAEFIIDVLMDGSAAW